MLEIGNGYIYINNQGYILEISNNKMELPIIQGYITKEEDLKLGNRLCNDDLEKLNIVIDIVNKVKNNQLENVINKINISNKNNYILILENEKIAVNLGKYSNINDKILILKEVLKKENGKQGEIIFDDDNINKAIFREKV